MALDFILNFTQKEMDKQSEEKAALKLFRKCVDGGRRKFGAMDFAF